MRVYGYISTGKTPILGVFLFFKLKVYLRPCNMPRRVLLRKKRYGTKL